MAYPNYEGNGGIASGTNFNVVVPYPVTVNLNDILIAHVMDADNDSFDTPSGWVKFASDDTNNNLSIAIYWKRADGTETGSETFTSVLNSGSLVAGIMHRFSGCVQTGQPFDQSLGTITAQRTSTGFTWTNNHLGTDRLVCGFFICEDDTITGFTGSTDWAERNRSATTTGSDCEFSLVEWEAPDLTTNAAEARWTHGNEYTSAVFVNLKPIDPPVVTTLDTADLTDFGTDQNPIVEFTGDAGTDEDIEYNIQIDTVNTFNSGNLIDKESSLDAEFLNTVNGGDTNPFNDNEKISYQTFGLELIDGYDETKESASTNLGDDVVEALSQSFTGDGSFLEQASIWGFKNNSYTGNIVAKIYAHSGTFGTSSEPTGAALATSDVLDGSTIPITYEWIDFTFSTPFQLVNTTKYVLVIEADLDDSSNYISTTAGNLTPVHEGNFGVKVGTWFPNSGLDLTFRLNAMALQDLSFGTWFWRVRGKNPSGGNTYGEWSGTRSFTISEVGVTITDVGINIADQWKKMASAKINIGDSWKDVVAIKINVGGIWKDVL